MSWSFEEYSSNDTKIIFQMEELESSEDPPIREWSSLNLDIPENNEKNIFYEQGLYEPGSEEVCATYNTISENSILQHLYYNYPAVIDPGINDALLLPEKSTIYPDDGQDLYIETCKQMEQVPIRKFYRDLLKEEINLAYYCVDPKGVRAMAQALTDNNVVKILNLTDNFLTDDACFHLGEMLTSNSTLQELCLSGCKIKASGAKRLLKGIIRNRSLKTLNLNRNDLNDDGVEYVAKAIARGVNIQNLYLSYNNISAAGASSLAGAFEMRSELVKLDLSWNCFIAPESTYNLLVKLGESEILKEIDLSWTALTGPRIGTAIKLLMKAPNLCYLNLSNNALSGEAVINLIGSVGKANKLVTLDLSFNPLTPADALSVLLKMKSAAVQVQNLLLENVLVNNEFLEVLKVIRAMKFRKNFFVTYGGVCASFKGLGPDLRELVLKRADYLSKKSKKRRVDVALIILQLVKDNVEVMTAKDFIAIIRTAGVPLDTNLIDTIVEVFAAPSTPKNKKINVNLLADYVMRLWPDRMLPLTSLPEQEPEPMLKAQSKRKQKGKTKIKK